MNSFIYSFNKSLWSTQDIPDTVLNAVDRETRDKYLLRIKNLTVWGEFTTLKWITKAHSELSSIGKEQSVLEIQRTVVHGDECPHCCLALTGQHSLYYIWGDVSCPIFKSF